MTPTNRQTSVPAIALLALTAVLATPAQAVVISAGALAASSQPATVAVSQDLQNGDFLIHANNQASLPHVTGDGLDETTSWQFDFSADTQYAAFMASGGLVEARLTLTLNTAFFINGIGPITDVAFPSDGVGGLFPQWVLPSFISGVAGSYSGGTLSTSLVALVGMNPSELFGWLSSHNGLFPMVYADDAIVTAASLSLVSVPVPEPSAWALWAGGLLGIGALYRRRARPNTGR